MTSSGDLFDSCPAGMKVLRRGDMIQMDGGLAIITMVNDCRATAVPLGTKTKVIANRFDGTKKAITVKRAPLSIAPHRSPDLILRHYEEDMVQEFLTAQPAPAGGQNQPQDNGAGKENGNMKKYKNSHVDAAVDKLAKSKKAADKKAAKDKPAAKGKANGVKAKGKEADQSSPGERHKLIDLPAAKQISPPRSANKKAAVELLTKGATIAQLIAATTWTEANIRARINAVHADNGYGIKESPEGVFTLVS